MLGHQAQRQLDEAARDALARIREDRERTDLRIRPLLAHIESHLFDPGLDVNQLKRRCGVRDNSIPILFHAQVGQPPHAYIEQRRLETACRLLADTDLKIWQIADLLGYSSIQVFSRAFTRWSGQRPTLYRKEHTRPADTKMRARKTPARHQGDPETLRRALDGALEAREARSLIGRLLELYPAGLAESTAAPTRRRRGTTTPREYDPALGELLDNEAIERVRAEAFWSRIEKLGKDEQRRRIHELQFETTALFDLLCERSLVDGRSDREHGVAVADLALVALATLERQGAPGYRPALQARAWALLANARRLSVDFAGAAEALVTAEKYLPPRGQEPLVWADVLQSKATLLWDRHRADEALPLIDRALALYREHGGQRQVARAVLLRGNIVLQTHGEDAARREFRNALDHLAVETDTYLAFAAYQGLADIYLRSRDFEMVARVLPKVEEAAARHPDPTLESYLLWLRGMVCYTQGDERRAVALLTSARERFAGAGSVQVATLISLDLAWQHAERGRTVEACRIAAEVLPVIESYGFQGESVAALTIFRKSLATGTITAEILAAVRAATKSFSGGSGNP